MTGVVAVALPVAVLLITSTLRTTYEATAFLPTAAPSVLRDMDDLTAGVVPSIRRSNAYATGQLVGRDTIEASARSTLARTAFADEDIRVRYDTQAQELGVIARESRARLSQRLATQAASAMIDQRASAARQALRESRAELKLRRRLLGARAGEDPRTVKLERMVAKLRALGAPSSAWLGPVRPAERPRGSASPHVARDVAGAAVLGLLLALTLLAVDRIPFGRRERSSSGSAAGLPSP